MAAPPVHDLDVHMDFEDVKRKQLGVKCTLTVLQWAGMVASAPTAQMKSAQLLLFLRREVNFLVRGTQFFSTKTQTARSNQHFLITPV